MVGPRPRWVPGPSATPSASPSVSASCSEEARDSRIKVEAEMLPETAVMHRMLGIEDENVKAKLRAELKEQLAVRLAEVIVEDFDHLIEVKRSMITGKIMMRADLRIDKYW